MIVLLLVSLRCFLVEFIILEPVTSMAFGVLGCRLCENDALGKLCAHKVLEIKRFGFI